ncbi:MAG TPA: SLBB domain-containing protein, partial [Rectinemataceae bacterium]
SPAAAGTGGAAAIDTLSRIGDTLSRIEAMFADQAAALGTKDQGLRQFGYSIFEKPVTAPLAAIGDDYVLGPGDGLVVYLWGDPVDMKEVSASYTLSVDRTGSVFLQPVGQVSVLGQNLGQVRATIKAMLDRRYKRLEMNLGLATLRQFPVFVSGYAVSPGTVLATGADTLFTVLARAGGVSKAGSLRSVTLRRGSETIALDLYDTLVSGASIDLRVREGDSIYIPAIGPVVALSGEIRRPGIYELKGETGLEAAFALGGGILPSARASGITRLRFGDSGRRIALGSMADPAFLAGKVENGDFYYLGASSALLVGQAELKGPVKYPGKYDLKAHKTLGALLAAAQVLPEANLYYGRVYRMDGAGRDRSFAFSPMDVLAAGDIELAEFDRVVLYRYDEAAVDADFDRFGDTVVLSGPVKYPGFYLFKEGMTLSSLMEKNALLLDASPYYAEIVSRDRAGKETYSVFSPEEVLSGARSVALSRLDRVRFYKRGEAAAGHDFNRYPAVVQLSGKAARPELYALKSGMKLSDILVKDQILLDTNLNYAEMTRLKPDGKDETFAFRPADVLSGAWDLALGPKDKIDLKAVGYSPAKPDFDRFSNAVRVVGPLRFPGLYAWNRGMKLSELLGLALPALDANRVYAEIERPRGGSTVEYLSFALREIESGVDDIVLEARDTVRLFSVLPPATVPEVVAPAAPVPATLIPAPAAADVAATPAASPAAPAAETAKVAPVPAAPIQAAKIEPKSADVVLVEGAVRYEGPYARRPGLKLSSIIKADQLLDSASLDYAELTRL